tara:strand:+ start:128 stop:397 length:270 start_codon:yes stop_codon:yes gene_type:complete
MYIALAVNLLIWVGLIAFTLMMLGIVALLINVAIGQIRIGAEEDDARARVYASFTLGIAMIVFILFITEASKGMRAIMTDDPTPFNHAD